MRYFLVEIQKALYKSERAHLCAVIGKHEECYQHCSEILRDLGSLPRDNETERDRSFLQDAARDVLRVLEQSRRNGGSGQEFEAVRRKAKAFARNVGIDL